MPQAKADLCAVAVKSTAVLRFRRAIRTPSEQASATISVACMPAAHMPERPEEPISNDTGGQERGDPGFNAAATFEAARFARLAGRQVRPRSLWCLARRPGVRRRAADGRQ